MEWYLIRGALYEGWELCGPFATKAAAVAVSYSDEPARRCGAGCYRKGKDYVLTRKAAGIHGFEWAFESTPIP